MINTIYVDVDGVLADFVQAVENATGQTIQELNAQNCDPIKDLLDRETPNGFFENLPYMHDFGEMGFLIGELIQANYKIRFLTACSETNFSAVLAQKYKWLERRFYLDVIPLIGVARSRDKAIYANPYSLLIDDRSRSCEPFRKAGGHAIKHKSAEQTRKEIYRLGLLVE